jgi:hypothetical protein
MKPLSQRITKANAPEHNQDVRNMIHLELAINEMQFLVSSGHKLHTA